MVLDSERLLAVILAIGTGVWMGGLLTVVLVVASSRKDVSATDRVALFRRFGRLFAVAFGAAGVLVIVPALALAVIEPGPLTTTVLVFVWALLLATAVGILQARRMTRLREAVAEGTRTTRLRVNAAIAAALRVLLVLGYLALLVLSAVLAATI